MNKANVWVVIPASGIGSRMNLAIPKQYALINNKTVLQHTIEKFNNLDFVKGIIVSLSDSDQYFSKISFKSTFNIKTCQGGKERFNSVLNALNEYADDILSDDWVMVHDAARPCITKDDIEKLYINCKNHSVGGILAFPVKDTLKMSNDNNLIDNTIDRSKLWHALTPQMFRYETLLKAINHCVANNHAITDDASAFEYSTLKPLLVEGREDNIKITRPADIEFAQWLLTKQSETH